MTNIEITQNDYGFALQFSLKNSDDSAYDLTGNTGIALLAQHVTDPALKVNGSMSVSGSPALGVVNYTVQLTDFPTAGAYRAQIQVSYASGTVTFNDININVAPELPVTP
jgi:hypothetical protein